MKTYDLYYRLHPIGWALIAAAALSLELTGCSTAVNMPTPLRAIRPAAELKSLGNFSDMGVLLYATEALDNWEGSGLTNEILALTGAGTIGGLATGALASPPAAQGMLLGANGVLMLLNLWRPVERAGAYVQGAGLIRESLGDYLKALMLDGYCNVPTNRVTPAGAVLFAEVNAAITAVANLKQGILDLGSKSVKQLQASRESGPLVRGSVSVPDGCR